MSEPIELEGHNYSIGQLPPLDQYNVMRRLMPALSSFFVFSETMQGGGDQSMVTAAAGQMIDALAHMTDENVAYVFGKCLSRVQRQNDNQTWSPVWTSGQLAFQDISMLTMVTLTVRSLRENLGSFSLGQLLASQGGQQQAPT